MLKSKDIADFVVCRIERIRANEPIPSDIHLFFKSNSHIMIWHTAGTVFTREMIEGFQKRKIHEVWVHRLDWEPFARFINEMEELPKIPVPPPPPRDSLATWIPPTQSNPPPTNELTYTPRVSPKEIADILLSTEKDEREKRAIAAKSARMLMGELASPNNLEEQDAVRRGVAKVIQDLLAELPGDVASSSSNVRAACKEIWRVAAREPGLCHGVNVSTSAVLFALAFGRIEQDLLADIALAGLIHDLGMTALPYQFSQRPRQSFTSEQNVEYQGQIEAMSRLLTTIAPEFPPRAMLLARHHHDHSSVSGSGSTLSELAQLIAISDFIDSICYGQWDGNERTFSDSLSFLEEMEKGAEATGRPRLFNPDILGAVVRWIRGNVPENVVAESAEIVTQQVRAVQSGR